MWVTEEVDKLGSSLDSGQWSKLRSERRSEERRLKRKESVATLSGTCRDTEGRRPAWRGVAPLPVGVNILKKTVNGLPNDRGKIRKS